MKLTQGFLISLLVGACVVSAMAPVGLGGSWVGPAEAVAQSGANRAQKSQRGKFIPKSGVLRFVAILEHAGVDSNEITGQIDGRYLQALKRVMRARGAADVAVFAIGGAADEADAQGMRVIVVRFDDQAALQRVVKSKQPMVRVEDCVVLPASESDDAWAELAKALVAQGGIENSLAVLEKARRGNAAALTLVELAALRSHIEFFALSNNNAVPDFKGLGWKQLIDAGHFGEPPANAMCETMVASKVVVIDTPGADGREVPLTAAGWVWNSADKTMHPAGMSEEQLTSIMNENEVDTTDWLMPPTIVIKGMLGEARIALANFYMEFEEGKERFPTLQELIDGRTELKQIPQNPFNGSAKVQAATWNERKPPISANQEAGWHYDEAAGKFWPNTNVVGESAW